MSEGLAQGPYVAARAGFEPTTLQSIAIDSCRLPIGTFSSATDKDDEVEGEHSVGVGYGKVIDGKW